MQEEPILAADQINVIADWLEYIDQELDQERIDLEEITTLQTVYDLIKDKTLV